ncbi:MAG: ABC transporter ATP-binding protein/permease [Vulcanococcus sp.]|uniref:ABC transporter ATP-binding protein n=1 Tax=Vulcanococcus sp. TaxID=2856995 RepID=UPI0025CC3322|nr:ABC transporter ATP-binding protein [Vulcanococcus sp.]MBW0166543.1 ABC transporter ATP-binding protein/permease [Vulcanococcus sp.]
MVQLPSKTLQQVIQLSGQLPPGLRRRVLVLLPISVVPGIFDALSIAVVAWMMSTLLGTRLRQGIPSLPFLKGDRLDQALLLIGLFIAFSWLRSLSKLVVLGLQERTTGQLWLWLTETIYARILSQPYEFHIGKNDKKLATQLLTNVTQIVKGVFAPLLQLQASLFTVFFLFVGLLYVGRWYAMVLFACLVVAYGGFSVFLTPFLRRVSAQKLRLASSMKQGFFESMNVIREIHLSSAEPFFRRAFSIDSRKAKRVEALNNFLPNLPKQIIEPVGITLIFSFGAFPVLLGDGKVGDLKQIIPFLATLALASQRITPAMNELFKAVTRLRASLPNLTSVLGFLDLPSPSGMALGLASQGISPEGIRPRRSIRLHDVTYCYPGRDEPVITGLNLAIPVGSRVALVGSTGSGKSTTAHLLLGLLTPQQGALEIDGLVVEPEDMRAWQSCCAYVPQIVSFLRGSVLENIAFAEDPAGVDQDRVWEALEAAQLQDVVASLPYGLYTPIGRDGLNLSGGQRQRLALARAFYRKAEFLLLDEATSALDNRTESEVIAALEIVARRCTTVVIAHRLSTIERCDRIYQFDAGRLTASGSFEQLRERSESFKDLTKLESRFSIRSE